MKIVTSGTRDPKEISDKEIGEAVYDPFKERFKFEGGPNADLDSRLMPRPWKKAQQSE